jgi:hypothetical protein
VRGAWLVPFREDSIWTCKMRMCVYRQPRRVNLTGILRKVAGTGKVPPGLRNSRAPMSAPQALPSREDRARARPSIQEPRPNGSPV